MPALLELSPTTEYSPSTNLTERIPALDAVRGLAILMVTSFRFFPDYDDPSSIGRALTRAIGFGVRGVDLFFVLSGFLITGILYDAKTQPHFFKNFYARRALRIFPLYYSVLFVTLVVLPAIGFATSPVIREGVQHSLWLWFYGANILLASEGDWCLGSFNHFWSLAVEEHFYLVWPLVIFFCSRATAIRVCAGLIGLSVLARAAWLYSGGNEVAVEVFTLFRLDALALGGLLALIARGPSGLKKIQPWMKYGLIAIIVVMVPPISVGRRIPALRETMYALALGAVIVLAVTTSAGSKWKHFWNAPILRFFGKYSYGMYVFQNFLKFIFAPDVIIASLTTAIGSIFLARCGYLVVMSIATIAAAIVSWHLLEKHFLRMKTKFGYKKREAKIA